MLSIKPIIGIAANYSYDVSGGFAEGIGAKEQEWQGFSVGTEPWLAIIPKDHPLVKQEGKGVPLACLDGEPLIVPSRKSRIEAIRNWFGEIGLEPNILCETSNYVDAVALAERGVGISIFPQTTVDS